MINEFTLIFVRGIIMDFVKKFGNLVNTKLVSHIIMWR